MDLSDAIVIDGIEYQVLLKDYALFHVENDVREYIDSVHDVFGEPDPTFALKLRNLVSELFVEAIYQVEPTIASRDVIPRFLYVPNTAPLFEAEKDKMAYLASVFWSRLAIKRLLNQLCRARFTPLDRVE